MKTILIALVTLASGGCLFGGQRLLGDGKPTGGAPDTAVSFPSTTSGGFDLWDAAYLAGTVLTGFAAWKAKRKLWPGVKS